jgi:hypothetical protein
MYVRAWCLLEMGCGSAMGSRYAALARELHSSRSRSRPALARGMACREGGTPTLGGREEGREGEGS